MEPVAHAPAVRSRRKAVFQCLLLAVLIACVFGILWANRQARAISHFKRLGSRFYYSSSNWTGSGPAAQLISHLRMFRDVTGIDLTASELRDSDLAWLKPISKLAQLNLSHTQITDEGLKHLYELDNLGSVNLVGTSVTRAGVEALQRARPKLRIDIQPENRATIPHLWLSTVADHPSSRLRLWYVDFSNTKDLQGKQHPKAGDADVRSAVKLLAEMTQLRSINLSGTDVTDAGLQYLKELQPLEKLDLSETIVSDAGLVHLTGLSELKELYLRGTQVTDRGAKALHDALPGMKIFR